MKDFLHDEYDELSVNPEHEETPEAFALRNEWEWESIAQPWFVETTVECVI